MKTQKNVKLLGTLATIVCMLMYISYIPQIISNFSGNPVSPLQPLVATVNATLWVTYGWSTKPKSWPVIIANIPGIIFGLITFVTVYIH